MTNTVDVIISFHNGLSMVIDCLDSIIRSTRTGSYKLFLIDDNSDWHTHNYIQKWAANIDHASVFSNTRRMGYLKSTNSGIGLGTAAYFVLMPSDVVVAQGWLDRLMACAEKDHNIALVTPLVSADLRNGLPLPPGIDLVRMNEVLLERFENPAVDMVNGQTGCILLRRSAVNQVGLFDAAYNTEEFGKKDLCMRLCVSGYRTVMSRDVYVYRKNDDISAKQHDQWHGDQRIFNRRWRQRYRHQYQDFVRLDLMKPFKQMVDAKTCWDPMPVIWKTARSMLAQIRANDWIAAGNAGFRGALKLVTAKRHLPSLAINQHTEQTKRMRVTYILHHMVVAGGVLSVIQIVNELILLGVDARIVTLFKDPAISDWTRLYTEPMVFKNPQELFDHFPQTDLVVATLWTTAALADQLVRKGKALKSVYFIQDYEPWFFPESDQSSRQKVQQTYAMIPNRIVKSRWLSDMLGREGHQTRRIRLGMDLSVFYPRDVNRNHPVVLAMARPMTPQRGFASTIQSLASVKKQRPDVEIVLFGDRFLRRQDIPFAFRDEGVVTNQAYMAELYSEATVFLDGSDFQGFGRCGLEAMACGAACVLTGAGGVTEYAIHDYNALVVPPKRPDLFADAILTLLDNPQLRKRLVEGGLQTINKFCHKREARETHEYFASLFQN